MAIITVDTPRGEQAIEATIEGQLAYHQSLNNPKYYTITHVKSGRIALDLVFKRAVKKVMAAMSTFDIDGWYTAGYPDAFWTDEQRKLLAETRAKYCGWD